jgi:actin
MPAFYLTQQPAMTLYAHGQRKTGLVVESSDSVTQICAVYEGSVLPNASTKWAVAGRDVTSYLHSLIQTRGGPTRLHDVAKLKEESAFVSLDYDRASTTAQQFLHSERSFHVGDVAVPLSHELFQCAECLFEPSLCGKQSAALDSVVYDTIMQADELVRDELFGNIVLGGGNTMFTDLSARLESTVRARAGSHASRVKVSHPIKYANASCRRL